MNRHYLGVGLLALMTVAALACITAAPPAAPTAAANAVGISDSAKLYGLSVMVHGLFSGPCSEPCDVNNGWFRYCNSPLVAPPFSPAAHDCADLCLGNADCMEDCCVNYPADIPPGPSISNWQWCTEQDCVEAMAWCNLFPGHPSYGQAWRDCQLNCYDRLAECMNWVGERFPSNLACDVDDYPASEPAETKLYMFDACNGFVKYYMKEEDWRAPNRLITTHGYNGGCPDESVVFCDGLSTFYCDQFCAGPSELAYTVQMHQDNTGCGPGLPLPFNIEPIIDQFGQHVTFCATPAQLDAFHASCLVVSAPPNGVPITPAQATQFFCMKCVDCSQGTGGGAE